jgi:hypothetical protein
VIFEFDSKYVIDVMAILVADLSNFGSIIYYCRLIIHSYYLVLLCWSFMTCNYHISE